MYAIAAYGVQCLAAGCWLSGSGAGQQGVCPRRGMLHLTLTASGQALHTVGGNSIHIV